ncbi:Endonuclease/exonuclease/phosphatase [Piromyces finnis]|uniref:Endonuclease/exonuclease/phosphatase n=1 Tax=Piromyces finnis TaxID=1754191 RepID=A0A1Y1VAW1_9FUNG|nr:Endonuclease/exonuclease/phosphatase [Piromyces finnis]|eukprot:ORX51425.1 Endonuclease/exonuclease/phosphatase [Piromyces finnis]
MSKQQQQEEYLLYERKFITLNKNVPNTIPSNKDDIKKVQTITLMSYNILAQCLIHRELYPYCKEKKPLKLSYRTNLLMKEFESIQPDIATFQEVDGFYNLYQNCFEKLGYDYKYIKKQIKDKVYQHGVCILWKKEKFSEVQYNGFLFDESPLVTPTDITPYTGNTGQIIALRFNNTNENAEEKFSNIENEELKRLEIEKYNIENDLGIIISNHHLYWKPKAKYEKLRQIYVMLNNIYSLKNEIEQDNIKLYNDVCNKIKNFENTVEKQSLNKWPVIMCGDFNTSPDQEIYKLITKQELNKEELKELEPKIESETEIKDNPLTSTILIEEIKKFPKGKSSYSSYRDNDPSHTINPNWKKGHEFFKGEPTYTTYCGWKGTLDYEFIMDDNDFKFNQENNDISFNPTYLKVTKNLNVPKSDILEPGLPNLNFPSDHICIMSEIELYQ